MPIPLAPLALMLAKLAIAPAVLVVNGATAVGTTAAACAVTVGTAAATAGAATATATVTVLTTGTTAAATVAGAGIAFAGTTTGVVVLSGAAAAVLYKYLDINISYDKICEGLSFVFISFKEVSQRAISIGLQTWARCGVYFEGQTLHVHVGCVMIKVGRKVLKAILVWNSVHLTGPGKGKSLVAPIPLNNTSSRANRETGLNYHGDTFESFRNQHLDEDLVVSITYMDGDEIVAPPRESTPHDVVRRYYASTSTNPLGIRARAIHGALPLTSR